jgi:hypothetical protein
LISAGAAKIKAIDLNIYLVAVAGDIPGLVRRKQKTVNGYVASALIDEYNAVSVRVRLARLLKYLCLCYEFYTGHYLQSF